MSLRTLVKKAVMPFMRGRWVDIRPNDYVIVSYPRSGNTMLRYALAYILAQGKSASYKQADIFVPDIYIASNYQLSRIPAPRYVKSHECFQPHYRKVLYLVRNPRDVAISYYNYKHIRGEIDKAMSFEEFLNNFLDGGVDRFGAWPDHVASWLSVERTEADFKLVQYEHLLADKKTVLRDICEFLNIAVTDDVLDKTVDVTDVQKMHQQWQKENGNKKAVDDFSRACHQL